MGRPGWSIRRAGGPVHASFLQSVRPRIRPTSSAAFLLPARYYTCLHGLVPEIVEALVLPLPDGMGTIWICAHDEAIRFDGEHVRIMTGLATFMATSLKLLRLTHQAQRVRGGTERDLTPPHGCTVAEASSGTGVESASALELSLPLRANPVERYAANVPTLATKNAGNDLAEARGLAHAEQQRGAAPVNGRTEMHELLLACRALVEQVRLVLRDGRRLIRRLIAVCKTSECSSRVQRMTSGPAPLASVPLVVLRSTTDREQIKLHDLVQNLSAEGYRWRRADLSGSCIRRLPIGGNQSAEDRRKTVEE
jgi:hypothetical protein